MTFFLLQRLLACYIIFKFDTFDKSNTKKIQHHWDLFPTATILTVTFIKGFRKDVRKSFKVNRWRTIIKRHTIRRFSPSKIYRYLVDRQWEPFLVLVVLLSAAFSVNEQAHSILPWSKMISFYKPKIFKHLIQENKSICFCIYIYWEKKIIKKKKASYRSKQHKFFRKKQHSQIEKKSDILIPVITYHIYLIQLDENKNTYDHTVNRIMC
jgi:hypothetical protein